MNIRKIATITALVLSSLAATDVAPSKAELESMYDKAFREFNANNFPQALKDLDAIDARQPDLAESQNLRGVILMRQAAYDQAEVALQKALAADPKFWNARFNLAEMPFLRKDWAEARKRFEALLQGNASELQGEAAQLIQYKILLTYLLEGKENMVDSILAKFELSPDTPAVHYANAAVAFQHKNEKEAKDWLTAAEKNFSPQLNKLFAESLYEVGWLQKPAGQTRAAVELTSAADRQAKAKALAKEKFEEAEQAFQHRDLTAARKLVDEADAADPNQAASINLRGEILLAQKDFDGAENAFKQASKIDPKFREAQYNLAQIPFKKKEYSKARDRFEALFSAPPTGDKDQAAQLIKFKIYLTLVLEGKDSRAQKMMEQFQFTGDTPALYYAQAAWEFKHNNPAKANDWIVSARKIYSPALNLLFADGFYDVGWLQNMAAAPAPATTETAKVEATPSIEPSPIPGAAVAANKSKKQPSEAAPNKSPATVAGMEATTANAAQSPAASQALMAKNEKAPSAPVSSPSVETPVASPATAVAKQSPANVPPVAQQSPANAPPLAQQSPANVPPVAQQSPANLPPVAQQSPANAAPVAQQSPANAAPITQRSPANAPPAVTERSPANAPPVAASTLSATPATVLAPATVQEWSKPSVSERLDRFGNWRVLFVGGLLLAGILLLAWVVTSGLRRRVNISVYRPSGAVTSPRFAAANGPTTVEKMAAPARLTGGPPQVSLQLKASEPSVRRAAVPFGKPARPFGTTVAAVEAGPIAESVVSKEPAAIEEPARFEEPRQFDEPAPFEEPAFEEPAFAPNGRAEAAPSDLARNGDAAAFDVAESELPPAPNFLDEPDFMPAKSDFGARPQETVTAVSPGTFVETPSEFESVVEPITSNGAETIAEPAVSRAVEFSEPETEPVAQGQPIPYQVPAFSIDPTMSEITKPEPESMPARVAQGGAAGTAIAGAGALHHSVESPSFAPQVISTEPLAQQPTKPTTMPEQTQPIPAIRTPQMTGDAPQSQPASGMQTAVQLTFSFEIASLQLTPSFKMGALQLKPTSKIVMMRLAPSPQPQPQPAMNLQVTFEIATVQLAGNSLGMIRLTPSQQQRPGVISSSAFNIAGLQLLSGESGAVQLTPSQQGQASVHVTGRFQIATVEFSPSFEIASIVLNSTSRQVSVQLPGAGPSAIEGAPVFDIANVQLAGNGEIGMMQLNPPGSRPKAA